MAFLSLSDSFFANLPLTNPLVAVAFSFQLCPLVLATAAFAPPAGAASPSILLRLTMVHEEEEKEKKKKGKNLPRVKINLK